MNGVVFTSNNQDKLEADLKNLQEIGFQLNELKLGNNTNVTVESYESLLDFTIDLFTCLKDANERLERFSNFELIESKLIHKRSQLIENIINELMEYGIESSEVTEKVIESSFNSGVMYYLDIIEELMEE